MAEFDDKVVIVTGACGGIGEPIARRFAAEGAKLGICDAREDRLEELAGELRAAGTEVHVAAVDVTREELVSAFCAGVGETLGGIDTLINTVGVFDAIGDVEELPTSEWERCMAINLTSAFLTAKHSLPFLKRKGGVIVNIASVSGVANQEDAMIYSVTKAGLLSLTRSEAIDLAKHGIRAVAICPGSVYTSMVYEAADAVAERAGTDPKEQLEGWESQYPTKRFTRPEEVADLALFLCGERAQNITGTQVMIDGGLTAMLQERL